MCPLMGYSGLYSLLLSKQNLPLQPIHYSLCICHYNVVSFLKNPHKRHPIAHPLGRDMGCFFWIQTLIYIMSQWVQWCMQYHLILDRIITAPDCILGKGCLANVFFFLCVFTPFFAKCLAIQHQAFKMSWGSEMKYITNPVIKSICIYILHHSLTLT